MSDLQLLNSHEIKSEGISFMKSKLGIIALLVILMISAWSCKETTPTASGVISRISGVVYDISATQVIANAAVYLSTTAGVDSAYTKSDGTFYFEIDLGTVTNNSATISVRKAGYLQKSFEFSVASDTTLEIGLEIDAATLAIVTGTVRDSSAYLYPLRNTTVLLLLPGYIDSVVTEKEGTFRFTADLIDRDSVQATLTIFKTGYATKSQTLTLYRGATRDLGNVLLAADRTSTTAFLDGRAFDATSRLPLYGVEVTMISDLRTDSVGTAVGGDYSFSVDLQGLPSFSGLLKVAKNGYKPQTSSFEVSAGKTTSQDFYLVRDTTTSIRDTSTTSLYAHSIAFVKMTANQISVYGVGGVETSIITWEVRDSLGFPIDIDHHDTVEFALVGNPVNGGAYVSPSRAVTNASGRVSTTINSGTISGVVQFITTIHRRVDGMLIQSMPVIITINAGLPDQAHFSIGAHQLNFAGYDWLAHTDDILVQVGDKYSNPVKASTAVYFNTTGGVVLASGFTDATSHATVTLYSGNPLPKLELSDLAQYGLTSTEVGDGTGYLWVKSQTLGENNVTVQDSILLLMSGSSEIYVTLPGGGVHVDSGSCIQIPVQISDRFGNPLAPGTTISTQIEYHPPEGTNWGVSASGLPVDALADYLTRGPGRTDFTLSICDATAGGTPDQMPFVVTIRITGPNGNVFTTINGNVGP
jgi:hypothetical protein